MDNKEKLNQTELLRRSLVTRLQQRLESAPRVEWPPIVFDEDGWVYSLFRAIRGRKIERKMSLPIGQGYEWVGISEDTTVRNGRTKLDSLLVAGEVVRDSEGRQSPLLLWQIDLTGNCHPEDLRLFDELLEAQGQLRDDLFAELTKQQQSRISTEDQ